MRSFAFWLFVACSLVAVTASPAFAQNPVTRSQIDALLNAYEGVAPELWRGLGNGAAPILESIAADQSALPTRRARSLDGLAALGSGAATMRALANSSTAPIIVRMSAVRGLRQVLPDASLIDALRPLLQDPQWQVRGVAAETLSNTPAGCAAINDMAKLETAAWRSRFVRLCTQPASSATTPMAPDAPAAGDPTSRIVMYRIFDPTPTKIYDYGNVTNLAKVLPPTGLGAVSVLMPNSPALTFSSGSWKFYPLGSKATVADFQSMIKTPLSAGLNSGTLNANLYFVGVPGLTAATAPANSVFQSVLSKVNTIYAQIGVQLGTVKYIDITGADATTYTDVDNQSEFDALMKLSANAQAADGAINLFLVHSISGGSPGFIILGESAGIPGVPVRGTSGSGVAVTMADFPNGLDDLAKTIAHESGHWLGLFHTTESAGTSFDALADTPQCPKVPNDTNNDGYVDAAECAALDGPNLMFWTSLSGPQPSLLTSDQKFVQLRNPTVNVPNTQVDIVSYGQLNVPVSSFTTVITPVVPADAASLTVVGVVTESPVTVPDRLRYVNAATATGAHDGTSWTDAYSDLAAALAAEPAGTKFWVAKGIYKPSAASRSAAFTVKPDMAVYGGFAGTETILGQRNPAANPTVLSGDIDSNDTGVNGIDADTSKIVGNNSYHVVVLDGTTGTISSSTILDGLTITGGKADAAGYPDNKGGGVLCNTACDATLSNLYFAGNYAAYIGGAFYIEGASSPLVTNTTFAGNAAVNGGAVFQYLGAGTAPVYANVTFAGNSVSDYGGAIYNYQTTGSASLAMTNVTFSDNHAGYGGGAMAHYNCGATLTSTLTNAIIWGNTPDSVVFVCDTPTFKNSIVQGSGGSAAWNASYGIDGGGNLATDPLLRPLTNNGGSTPTVLPSFAGSAIDAGLDSACVAAPVNAVDQRGIARPFGPHCDVGATEVKTLVITSAADPGDGVCDGTCTLRDAITATQSAGASVHDVVFDPSFNTPQTINLTAALPLVTKDMTINGPGANLLTVRRDTGGDYRIFAINPTATVSLAGLTIANGKNAFGGGINNFGRLTIDRCMLTGNLATSNGGAIQNTGALVVTNSTISGNTSAHGGGLYNYANPAATCPLGCSASVINTTISGNIATTFGGSAYGGGIIDYNYGGVEPTVTLTNSTVAGNSEPGILAYDGGGPATIYLQNTIVTSNQTQDLADFGPNPHVISRGHNLTGGDGGGYFTQPGDQINTNPKLTSLGNYGGTTQTLYPNPGSPAIDAGDDTAAPASDQRGVLRPYGAHVDIGAVEANGSVIFQNGFEGF